MILVYIDIWLESTRKYIPISRMSPNYVQSGRSPGQIFSNKCTNPFTFFQWKVACRDFCEKMSPGECLLWTWFGNIRLMGMYFLVDSSHMSKLGLPYLPKSLVWTKKKFGQVLLLSTYPKSLEIFELKFVLKRIFSYFCKDTIG